MPPRDTGTGAMLEEMVLPALQRGGYKYQKQVHIGVRFGGGRHIVDVVATDAEGGNCLVSLKWQEVSGTAEQKVPFEAMCLADAIITSKGLYTRAYLVLGGRGWKLREFFTGGGLKEHLTHSELVTIMSLEDFAARAGRGRI
jgi:hypothetical protein